MSSACRCKTTKDYAISFLSLRFDRMPTQHCRRSVYDYVLLAKLCMLFTRATLCVERVFARATCPSVRYSRYCIKTKTERASVMISSPSDSPMISLSGEVWLVVKFTRGHPQRGRFVRVGWVRTGDFCDFSTYKLPYLRNGARYDQGYYWTLIGNRMSAFDWYHNERPWMTLNWPWAAITRFLRYTSVFRSPPRKYEWT